MGQDNAIYKFSIKLQPVMMFYSTSQVKNKFSVVSLLLG